MSYGFAYVPLSQSCHFLPYIFLYVDIASEFLCDGALHQIKCERGRDLEHSKTLFQLHGYQRNKHCRQRLCGNENRLCRQP